MTAITVAGICTLVLAALTLIVATASAVRTALAPIAGPRLPQHRARPSRDRRATLTLSTAIVTLFFHTVITVPAVHIPVSLALLTLLASVVAGGLAAFTAQALHPTGAH